MTAPFQVHDVEELLALMEQWQIAEVHLTLDDATLHLARERAFVCATNPTPLPEPAEAPAESDTPAVPMTDIVAPVVGIFHLARQGYPMGIPQVGDQVQAGQVLGSIELMHVPTDLVSPVAGIIHAMRAEDGAGVEYGQPLLTIQPYEEVSEHEAGMLAPPLR